MLWTIDRIEGDLAILECNGLTFPVPLSALPTPSEGARYTLSLTPGNHSEAQARLTRLRTRGPQGPGEFDL